MREDLVIRNFGDEPTFCSVELFVDSDFADLFAVKEGRAGDPDGEITRDRQAGQLGILVPPGHGQPGHGASSSRPPRRSWPTTW